MANIKPPATGKSDSKTDKAMGPASANTSGAAQKPKSGGFSFANFFSFGKMTPKRTVAIQQSTTQTGLTAQTPITKSPVGSKTITTPALGATPTSIKVTKPVVKTKAGFKLPLVGNKPVETQLQVLGSLALLFLALSAGSVVWDAISRSNNATYINITSQLQFHTQRLAKSAGLAARGDAGSFQQLKGSRDEFTKFVTVLNKGGAAFNTNVPPAAITVGTRNTRCTGFRISTI